MRKKAGAKSSNFLSNLLPLISQLTTIFLIGASNKREKKRSEKKVISNDTSPNRKTFYTPNLRAFVKSSTRDKLRPERNTEQVNCILSSTEFLFLKVRTYFYDSFSPSIGCSFFFLFLFLCASFDILRAHVYVPFHILYFYIKYPKRFLERFLLLY